MNKSIALAATLATFAMPAAAQAKPHGLSIASAHRQSAQVIHDEQIARSTLSTSTVPVRAVRGYIGDCHRLGRQAVLCEASVFGSLGEGHFIVRSAKVLVVNHPGRSSWSEADLIA